MDADSKYMTRALELAARGRGATRPNPMVGCVIVQDGEVLAEGFHTQAGAPHAEVEAVRALKGSLKDQTVYINLEPCCFSGKTPPCTDLFLNDHPLRVVVAMEDPNPKVAGKGIQLLRDAGIQVDVGILEDEARRLNEVFIKNITTGKPFVIAKCAMSLDGKLPREPATPNGSQAKQPATMSTSSAMKLTPSSSVAEPSCSITPA